MQITDAKLRHQVARMAQMVGFPKGDDSGAALAELWKAASVANDLPTLTRVISGILESAKAGDRCPMPADLRRKISEAQKPRYWEPDAPEKPNFRCIECQDYGMSGGTSPDNPWKWCSCAAGARRRSAEPSGVLEANKALERLVSRPALRKLAAK